MSAENDPPTSASAAAPEPDEPAHETDPAAARADSDPSLLDPAPTAPEVDVPACGASMPLEPPATDEGEAGDQVFSKRGSVDRYVRKAS